MIEASAQAAEIVSQAQPTGWDFGALATLGSLCAIAFTGWNLYLQSKMASLSKLWQWRDEFIKQSAQERLDDVREYATKAEVQALVTRLDKQFSDVHAAIGKLGDKLDQWKQES